MLVAGCPSPLIEISLTGNMKYSFVSTCILSAGNFFYSWTQHKKILKVYLLPFSTNTCTMVTTFWKKIACIQQPYGSLSNTEWGISCLLWQRTPLPLTPVLWEGGTTSSNTPIKKMRSTRPEFVVWPRNLVCRWTVVLWCPRWNHAATTWQRSL